MMDDLMPTSPEMDKADARDACPVCFHRHLNYLDDEPCVSCGCDGQTRPPLEATDGDLRIQAIERDKLATLARYTRAEFGEAEGNALLRASLDRLPPEGAPEGDYFVALRIVIRERHPLWAAKHADLYDDVPPMEQPR